MGLVCQKQINSSSLFFLRPRGNSLPHHLVLPSFLYSASVKLFVLPDRRRCRSASQFPFRHFTVEMMFPFLGTREPAESIVNNDDLPYALYPLADF